MEIESAMLEHCQKVYSVLLSEATLEEAEGDDAERTVWTGHTTRVIREAGLSSPYYTTVLNHLKRMGCIEQVRRGGGTSHSKWILWHEPTMELFTQAVDSGKKATGSRRQDILEQQLKDIRTELAEVQRRQGVVERHLGVAL